MFRVSGDGHRVRVFQVPYVAMPADMTDGAGLIDPDGERTRMMTWRVAFLALTTFVAQVQEAIADRSVVYSLARRVTTTG